jgi:hypothetical protein
MSKALLLFESTRAAIKAERMLESAGIGVKVLPVPKELSPECGIAIEVEAAEAPRIKTLLDDIGIIPIVRVPGGETRT